MQRSCRCSGNSMSTPICCWRWVDECEPDGRRWVWLLLLLLLRPVGGVLLPLLGDAIQRRVNSIAGDGDDSNSSLVRREFGRWHVSDVRTRSYVRRVGVGRSRELVSLEASASMTLSRRITAIDVWKQGDDVACTFINYTVPAPSSIASLPWTTRRAGTPC